MINNEAISPHYKYTIEDFMEFVDIYKPVQYKLVHYGFSRPAMIKAKEGNLKFIQPFFEAFQQMIAEETPELAFDIIEVTGTCITIDVHCPYTAEHVTIEYLEPTPEIARAYKNWDEAGSEQEIDETEFLLEQAIEEFQFMRPAQIKKHVIENQNFIIVKK